VDDWLSYGLFRNRRVSESDQREVRVRGDLGALALEAFENRWNGAGLLEIGDHYRIRLRFTVGDTVADHELRYVIHDGEHWVNVHPAALPHAFHPDHAVAIANDGRRRFVLTDNPPGSAASTSSGSAAGLYAAKYGPDPGAVLLRLTEA
jgi:hypothetical protein